MSIDAEQRVAVFRAVRDLPYAIDAAHSAHELEELGAGDCLAKSELLGRRLADLGYPVRLVRWRYELPRVVPEADALPGRIDVHRAAQVLVDGYWVLVDATHDHALRGSILDRSRRCMSSGIRRRRAGTRVIGRPAAWLVCTGGSRDCTDVTRGARRMARTWLVEFRRDSAPGCVQDRRVLTRLLIAGCG